MGFRTGAYAKVWEVQPKTPNVTSAKISISMRNKETGEFDTKFNEYVSFLGAGCAQKAAALKPGDSIKLGDIDVDSSKWDPEKRTKYYSWKIFSFENATYGSHQPSPQPANTANDSNPFYEGNQDEQDEGLPF